MIFIESYFESVPDSLSIDSLCKKRNQTKENPKGDSWFTLLMRQQHKHKFDKAVYGAKDVKTKLIQIFNNKCAFCECDTSVGAAYDVEHFRPKILYYWLCYEWTNLLLSCQTCNEIHKKTQFPLEKEDFRLKKPLLLPNGTLNKADCHIFAPCLQAEQMVLLHPAIDEPNEHLAFLPDGRVQSLTRQGETSIAVYGLNRASLVSARGTLIWEIQQHILREYKVNPLPSEERIKVEMIKIILTLLESIERNKPFIGFRRAILSNLNSFIIDNQSFGFDLPNKEIMAKAVDDFYKSAV